MRRRTRRSERVDLHITLAMMIRTRAALAGVALAIAVALPGPSLAQTTPAAALDVARPFGTLREQATLRQEWLRQRLETILPRLMRQYGVDMWVIPMREYNEDPVFSSIVSPTTLAARRRTIYVFFDRGSQQGVERLALGGTSQGGVYTAIRSQRGVGGNWLGANRAELWGDEQWLALKDIVEERNPSRIAIDKSRTWAFADGLSSGEYEGMREMLGEKWAQRFVPAEGLAVDFIAARLPAEEQAYTRLQEVVWALIDTAFSDRVITPGVTRTSDVVWWFRQRVNDLGLTSWFHPSVTVQRRGTTAQQLGEDPVIQRGDLLHCDVGLVALGLATDTQHMGYVLLPAETQPPEGLRRALTTSNRLQDIVMQEQGMRSFGRRSIECAATGSKEACTRTRSACTVTEQDRSSDGGMRRKACLAVGTIASFPACGSRSSCRRPQPCPSGAGSVCGQLRKRMRSWVRMDG